MSRDGFERLLAALRRDHDVLDIDGRRAFGYRSVYFDTPRLRCFHEHVEGRRPRFKARTRCYLDEGACQFEVKLTTRDGETDKHGVEHPPERADRLTDEARELVDRVLADARVQPAGKLSPVLATSFDRVTLAAREGGARMTCDLGLRLELLHGPAAALDGGLVLIETKSQDGRSRADEALARLGAEPRSMSKYRMAVDLLIERDRSGATAPLRRHFESVG
jgi:hypothetical protein